MLSERSSVDIHTLQRQRQRQGMAISEIARRTNHDRKTIRAYLNGERTPGRRERASPDPFDAFVDYVTARLIEDPHHIRKLTTRGSGSDMFWRLSSSYGTCLRWGGPQPSRQASSRPSMNRTRTPPRPR